MVKFTFMTTTKTSITAVIKNFLRNGKTENCANSLINTYPGIKIVIVDDSYPKYREEIKPFYKKLEDNGHKVIYTPFDIGVSLGRNIGIENVNTEYILIGDNDFVYKHNSGVERMASVLDSRKNVDIVCGGIIEDYVVHGEIVKHNKEMHYEGFVERELDEHKTPYLKYTSLDLERCNWERVDDDILITPIDLGFNYFLMRTNAYPRISWTPEIKVSLEHTDGMLRAKQNGLKMVYLKDAFVLNDIKEDGAHKDYAKFRNRFVGWDIFCKNWDVEYGIDFHGHRGDYTTYGH